MTVTPQAVQPPVAKSRKDLLAILSQKNTKEETDFLKKLIKYGAGKGLAESDL